MEHFVGMWMLSCSCDIPSLTFHIIYVTPTTHFKYIYSIYMCIYIHMSESHIYDELMTLWWQHSPMVQEENSIAGVPIGPLSKNSLQYPRMPSWRQTAPWHRSGWWHLHRSLVAQKHVESPPEGLRPAIRLVKWVWGDTVGWGNHGKGKRQGSACDWFRVQVSQSWEAISNLYFVVVGDV